jgi:hypothetical protein
MKILTFFDTIRTLTSWLSAGSRLKSYKVVTLLSQQEDYPLGAELRPYVALA